MSLVWFGGRDKQGEVGVVGRKIGVGLGCCFVGEDRIS